jgi:hypothetical protein
MSAVKFHCPGCGQHIEAPEEAAGCVVPCPTCQQQLRVPTASTVEAAPAPLPQAAPVAGLCAICQSPVSVEEPKIACPACRAEYHAECWQENGGCAVYGCEQVPAIEQRRAIEIPISYWGQENKPCPACRREILAAAVRCRHCGATFSSARPEDADEFQRRTAREERLPKVKRMVVWLFVFSVVPCCAPVGAIWGLAWYPGRRDDVRALPSIYAALCKIALGVAIGQCATIVLMAALYALFRGS